MRAKEIIRSRRHHPVVYFGIIPAGVGAAIFYLNKDTILNENLQRDGIFWLLFSAGFIGIGIYQLFYKIARIIIYEDKIEGKSILNTRTLQFSYSPELCWETREVREKYSRHELLVISDGVRKMSIASTLFGNYDLIKFHVQERVKGEATNKENTTPLLIILFSIAALCTGSLIYLNFYNTYIFSETNTTGVQLTLHSGPRENTSGSISFFPDGLNETNIQTFENMDVKWKREVVQYDYGDSGEFIFYFPTDEVDTFNASGLAVLHAVALEHYTTDKNGKDVHVTIFPLETFNGQLKEPDPGALWIISLFGVACLITAVAGLRSRK